MKSDFSWQYPLVMEPCCDTMLYTNLGWENFDAGHIKRSRGPQVSHSFKI